MLADNAKRNYERRILKCLDEADYPYTASKIARITGIPNGTTQDLLRSMAKSKRITAIKNVGKFGGEGEFVGFVAGYTELA